MLTERQIEDVFAVFFEELVEPGLKLVGRQQSLPSGLRFDLLFEDAQGRNVVFELKRDTVAREDVGQLLEYAGSVENCRAILAAPRIPASIKQAFEHYGIGYIEFSLAQIERLYRKLTASGVAGGAAIRRDPEILPIARKTVAKPLPSRRLHDGNVAFKVNFNDRNWSAACSPDTFQFNAFEKKCVYCRIQANYKVNCQSDEYQSRRLDSSHFPCYDAVAQSAVRFSSGWDHGRNYPRSCLDAKVGKLAFLTSRAPGEPEEERFVFSIWKISRLEVIPSGENKGMEYQHGDKSTALALRPDQRIRYWDFYRNPRAPEVVMFGAGLFRYIPDSTAKAMIEAVLGSKKLDADQRRRARTLLERVS